MLRANSGEVKTSNCFISFPFHVGDGVRYSVTHPVLLAAVECHNLGGLCRCSHPNAAPATAIQINDTVGNLHQKEFAFRTGYFNLLIVNL